MGLYIESTEEKTNVQWLIDNGTQIQFNAFNYDDVQNNDGVPVCVIDNGHFLAAAICFSEGEMNRFADPLDSRTKFWFIVQKEKLFTIPGMKDDFEAYTDRDELRQLG